MGTKARPAGSARNDRTKRAPRNPPARTTAPSPRFAGFPDGTLRFLRGLAKHNSKAWFDEHRDDYDAYYVEAAKAFVEAIGPRLQEISKTVQYEARVNGSLFRINRDVRFSKDKSPYKAHLDLWFWEGAHRGWESPGFFFRLAPTTLILGAGMHQLAKEQLPAYRAAVLDARAGGALAKLAEVLRSKGYALGGASRKTVPRGIDPAHPRAALLLHEGLHATWEGKVPPSLGTPKFVDECVAHFAAAAPVSQWLAEHVARGEAPVRSAERRCAHGSSLEFERANSLGGSSVLGWMRSAWLARTILAMTAALAGCRASEREPAGAQPAQVPQAEHVAAAQAAPASTAAPLAPAPTATSDAATTDAAPMDAGSVAATDVPPCKSGDPRSWLHPVRQTEYIDGIYVLGRVPGRNVKACHEPSAEVLMLAHLTVGAVAAEPPTGLKLSCGTAAGWLLLAHFTPKPEFRAGSPTSNCRPEHDPQCERRVAAVWRLPTASEPQLVPHATSIDDPVDVDGDGEEDGVASSARGTTVWFSDGASVTGNVTGAWVPLGKGRVLVQNGNEVGFSVSRARVFTVSRRGFVEAPELVKAAWESTYAARCPREAFSPAPPHAAKLAAEKAAEVARPCPAISDETRVAATEPILAAIVAESKETGVQITDGPPHFSWGCEQPRLTVLVTYCLGHSTQACATENGTWRQELWIRSPRGMTRATRVDSDSGHLEWSVNSTQRLVAHADLDGDGALDPIFETRKYEGEAVNDDVSFHAVVRGQVRAFLALVAHKDLEAAVFAVRPTGTVRDLVAISRHPSRPLPEGGPKLEGQGLTVWELGPRTLTRHRGAGLALAKRELAKLAKAP